MAAGVEANYIVAAAAALAGSLPSITGEGTDEEGTGAHIAAGQVREAALRLLVDIAKCVDFEKVPRAVDHFRSALVARSLGLEVYHHARQQSESCSGARQAPYSKGEWQPHSHSPEGVRE